MLEAKRRIAAITRARRRATGAHRGFPIFCSTLLIALMVCFTLLQQEADAVRIIMQRWFSPATSPTTNCVPGQDRTPFFPYESIGRCNPVDFRGAVRMWCDVQELYSNDEEACGVNLIGRNQIGLGTCNSNAEYECQEAGTVIQHLSSDEGTTCDAPGDGDRTAVEFLYRNGTCEYSYTPLSFQSLSSRRFTILPNNSIFRELFNNADCVQPAVLEKMYNESGCFNSLNGYDRFAVLEPATQEISSSGAGILMPSLTLTFASLMFAMLGSF